MLAVTQLGLLKQEGSAAIDNKLRKLEDLKIALRLMFDEQHKIYAEIQSLASQVEENRLKLNQMKTLRSEELKVSPKKLVAERYDFDIKTLEKRDKELSKLSHALNVALSKLCNKYASVIAKYESQRDSMMPRAIELISKVLIERKANGNIVQDCHCKQCAKA